MNEEISFEENFVAHLEISVDCINRKHGLEIIESWLDGVKRITQYIDFDYKIDENTLGVNN